MVLNIITYSIDVVKVFGIRLVNENNEFNFATEKQINNHPIRVQNFRWM